MDDDVIHGEDLDRYRLTSDLEQELEEERTQILRDLLHSLPEGTEIQGSLEVNRYTGLMVQASTEYRGAYITQTIQVEQLINRILALIFCGTEEQQRLFQIIVLERAGGINFSLKIDILIEAVQANYPEVHARFEQTQLFKLLQTVRKRRNRLAHASIDTDQTYVERLMRESPTRISQFRLVLWSKGAVTYDTVTIRETQRHYAEVIKATVGLANLLDALVNARNEPQPETNQPSG